MCEFLKLKVELHDPRFPKKAVGIYKLLYLRNGELISIFGATLTFIIEALKVQNWIRENHEHR